MKVGDKIIIVEPYYANSDYVVGDTGILVGKPFRKPYSQLWTVGLQHGVREVRECEFILLEEVRNMKAGDKIRVVAAQVNCAMSGETCAYETGDEGTIVSWLPHCKDLLEVDFGKPLPGCVWVKECELVVEKSVERRVDTANVLEEVRNMKVGDKIRVVAARANWARPGETCAYETGDEGTIVSWLPHCKTLLEVDFGKPLPGCVWVKECELVVEKSVYECELVVEKSVERRVDTANVLEEVRNMKVGDKIIMKDTAELWLDGERRVTLWTEGDEGIVDEVFPAHQVRVKFPNGKTGLCNPGAYDILPTAPAPVKRGMRIQAQETKTGDIEILGVSGLPYKDLPKEYRRGYPTVFGNPDGELRVVDMNGMHSWLLVPGTVFSKSQFDEILAVCEAAGSRLREINERRPEPFEVVI
jgi:hypothetical protein